MCESTADACQSAQKINKHKSKHDFYTINQNMTHTCILSYSIFKACNYIYSYKTCDSYKICIYANFVTFVTFAIYLFSSINKCVPEQGEISLFFLFSLLILIHDSFNYLNNSKIYEIALPGVGIPKSRLLAIL